jgi:hypothetical protein
MTEPNEAAEPSGASGGSAADLYEFFLSDNRTVDLESLLESLTLAQRKAIAFAIRATEECGDWEWDGEESVWLGDGKRTLAVAADKFDVCDPDSF